MVYRWWVANGGLSGLMFGGVSQLMSPLTQAAGGVFGTATNLVSGVAAPLTGVTSQVMSPITGLFGSSQVMSPITGLFGGATGTLGPVTDMTQQLGSITQPLSQMTQVTQPLLGGVTDMTQAVTAPLANLGSLFKF